MINNTANEALIIRYLLGNASEEEQVRLEEQFFADDDLYLEVKAIEDELLYEYAQGGLNSDQRKQFEARFLQTADGEQRVAMAKAVLGKTAEVRAETAALAPAPEKKSLIATLVEWLTPQRVAFASGAAALAMLSFGSWMALRSLRLADEVQQAKSAQQRAEQQLASAKAQEVELRRQMEKQGQQTPPQTSKGVFAFALMPGLTRGDGETKRLSIPAAGLAADVVLELEVKNGKAARYRAELQNLDGDVLWSRVVKDANLTIPARLFKPGDYVVVLKGLPSEAGGTESDAGEFYFQVVK